MELDALRGIAALMVFFFHMDLATGRKISLLSLGVTGADLFFIISGFVIVLSIRKVASAKEFIVKRISRLYPAYWVCVTAAFLSRIFSVFISRKTWNIPINQYAANMTMFQYYIKMPNIDDSYWTLIIELLFYVTILLVYKLKQMKNITLIGSLALIFIVCNEFVFEKIFVRLNRIHVHIPLINHFPLFFIGILCYTIIQDKQSKLKTCLYYLLLLFALTVQILLFDKGGKASGFISVNQYAIMLLLFTSSFILFINNKLGFISNRATLFLGRISFPLYLIHQSLSRDIFIPLFMAYFHMTFWTATLLILGIVILIAALISKYIEFPYGNKMKSFLLST